MATEAEDLGAFGGVDANRLRTGHSHPLARGVLGSS